MTSLEDPRYDEQNLDGNRAWGQGALLSKRWNEPAESQASRLVDHSVLGSEAEHYPGLWSEITLICTIANGY